MKKLIVAAIIAIAVNYALKKKLEKALIEAGYDQI